MSEFCIDWRPTASEKNCRDDLGTVSVDGYSDGIAKAISRDLISFYGTGSEPVSAPVDAYSHVVSGRVGAFDFKPTNTRALAAEACEILAALRSRGRLRILELGPGSGIASAAMRQLCPDAVLETVSLTPIDPFSWYDEEYVVNIHNRCGEPGVSGRPKFEKRTSPYLDLQHIGDIVQIVPSLRGCYDFIYDCFGPVFRCFGISASDADMSGSAFIPPLVELLSADGVFLTIASDGDLILERHLESAAGNTGATRFFPPLFAGTEIRTCILAKGRSQKTMHDLRPPGSRNIE